MLKVFLRVLRVLRSTSYFFTLLGVPRDRIATRPSRNRPENALSLRSRARPCKRSAQSMDRSVRSTNWLRALKSRPRSTGPFAVSDAGKPFQSPSGRRRAAERYGEAFAEAGLVDDVFQSLQASHDAVAGMIEDGRVNFVSFTGSVEGGCGVQRAAARRFIATNLELGGKDPAYVRSDAALEATIENLVDGAFFNAGQSCCAVERIYVHRDVYDRFVDGFVALTRQYRLGNPLDPDTTLGPMVRSSAAAFVRAQIAE